MNDVPDEFIERHPEVPWHQIRGMRNIITHAYEEVDSAIVWYVLTEDLPILELQCAKLLDTE